MRANRSTFAKLCLLTALAVPAQRSASATVAQSMLQKSTLQESTLQESKQKENTTQLLIAQASDAESLFPLPASLDGEETLLIDGSTSMRSMNTALTEQFQAQYEEADVEAEANGSDVAIERLTNGEIDLAAIGRPLTEEERAAGLTAVQIAREKIAIFVSPDNPFSGDLTFQDFGGIFRGEITDWSDVGGEPGPIRFVDRPELSDTRQAFRPYPVFQEAPFETGVTAEAVDSDETSAVIDGLGSDGVGYAIANQVTGNDSVKIISMHKVLPDDPAYPFSQPRSYVYAGEPRPAVQAFLGVATGEEGKAVVAEVRDAEGAAAVEIEGPPPTATSPDGTLTARTNDENLAVIEDEAGDLVAGPLAGAGGAVTALAFSDDGQTLATGTSSGQVRYWGVDGEPKSEAFQAITGADNAVSELRFDGDEKLFVGGSQGRRGFWGLNGLPFGETDGAAGAIAGAASSEARGLSPWLWLIPLLGLLGAGLWALLGRKRRTDSLEPPRQTAPTATVPPPASDPETEREVSNRAQSVISTDRVTDDSRAVETETPVPPSVPLPVGFPGVESPAAEASTTAVTPALPVHESTDLESPNLEGTNLDLAAPAAAVAGAAAIGGMAFAGLSSDVESDSEEDEPWDDNVDLSIDEPAATAEADGANPTAGLSATRSATASEALGDEALGGDEALSDVDTIEPTRNTVIAETETILDIEPTRETIIGDSAVIFGEAAASGDVEGEAAATSADRLTTDRFTAADGLSDTSVSESLAGSVAVDDPDAPPVANPDEAQPSPPSVTLPETSQPETVPPVPVNPAILGTAAAGLAAGGAAATLRSEDVSKGDVARNADSDEATVSPFTSTISNGDSIPLTIEDLASVDDSLSELPDGYGDSRIVLLPRDPQWAYAYWDVSNEHKEALRRQGGQRLVLRLYDVTDIDLSYQAPHSMQQQDCHEMARSWYLEVPVSDRDYVAEIGYLSADDRWLMLTRSAQVRVPPIYPSDWVKDQFVTIGWDESLTGRTFGDLGRPDAPATDAAATDLPQIYDDLFALTRSQDALRVAGSLYGSMQPVAPGALTASGRVSGLNVSGLNVSGLNMSGIGGASILPGRSRKFWLVADAELIVYGATEPDATLTVGDRVVPLNPDGTFRFHVAFPDGQIDYPIRAVAVDGEQSRSIHLHFERETPERHTNTQEEAKDEWF